MVNEIDLTGTQVGTFSAPWKNYAGGNPFPGVVPAPHNVTFPTSTLWVVVPPNLRPTNMLEWNFSYQRQFAGDWMASASYIGSKTSHLWLGYDMNAATPIAGIAFSDITDRRPLYRLRPQDGALIGNLLMLDDGANSNYNGLLLSVQHRFSHGFTLLSNYTWSRCISDGDSVGNLRQGYYQIQTNRAADRATATSTFARYSTPRSYTSPRQWERASLEKYWATGSSHPSCAPPAAWRSTSPPAPTIRAAATLPGDHRSSQPDSARYL